MAYKYKKIRLPDGSTIDGHRLLWATAYGPIPDGMVVHHKNEDTRDNRLDNLELMSRAAHSRKHAIDGSIETRLHTPEARAASAKARKKIGPDGTAWCTRCQDFLPVNAFTKNKWHHNGLAKQCRQCRSETRRKQ